MIIDKKTYPTNNHYKPNDVKSQIIINFSQRSGHNHIIRQNNREYGKSMKWNSYTVARDGIIYEHFNPSKHSDFLGDKKLDSMSINITVENFCSLIKENDRYYSWLNEECDIDRVGIRKYNTFNYWETIDENQIISLSELCIKLCDDFKIINNCIEFDSYNSTISKYKGIVFYSNYIENSGNINPFFDIDKFNKLLKNNIAVV